MNPIETLSQALLAAEAGGAHRPALYYFDTEWNYGDLLERVMRLAGGLREVGVNPGDRVLVMLQNMPATVVSYLAVWALGASVVPLNVMFQRDEISQHVRDSRARVMIALASVAGRAAGLADGGALDALIVVDDREDFLGEAPSWLGDAAFDGRWGIPYRELLQKAPLTPDGWHHGQGQDLALLTYTSGTTGQPKGAMNAHVHILYNVELYRDMAALPPDTVNVAFAPLFHITGAVAGLGAAIHLQHPLVLLHRFDPVVAARAIARHRATFTVGAITTFLGMLQLPDLERYDLSSLTYAYSGGAPVPAATVERFEEATGVYIHNVYGLTESANGIIMVPWGERAPVDPDSGALSIGKAPWGIRATIRDLDNPTRHLNVEGVGELALSGPSIIAAYWERPDANQASFCGGAFLTGDVARIDQDGWIYVVDRKKDMIISSGNKVWPRDVEDVLYQHPGVRETVVVGLPDPYRGEAVTAFVVRHPDHPLLGEDELIQFVRQRIAAYKVPRRVHWVDAIPKTASGKFLRRAFRENFQGD